MNEAMKTAWLEISGMLGEPTREELDVFLRTWQRATEAHKKALAEQPAQQEPVVFYRCNGCGHAYEQVHPTSCDCMEDGGFDRVEYYTSPPAQQEPVATIDNLEQEIYENTREFVSLNVMEWLLNRLNTSPPAQRTWVGLTDEEIYSVLENLQVMHHRPPTTDSRIVFARAIEAKIKEKNQ